MKKFLVSLIVLALCLFTIACGSTTHKCNPDEECCDGEGLCPEVDDVDNGDTDTDDGSTTTDTDTDDSDTDTDTDTDTDDADIPDTDCNSVICKIQKGETPEGTEVTVNECVVTGILYNQDKNDNYKNISIKGLYVSDIIPQAKPYTGIYVFIEDSAALDDYAIGDKLEVSGKYTEYYESSQIEMTEIKKLGKADLPEPAKISDPSKIATPFEVTGQDDNGYDVYSPTANHGADAESYESVLVKVTNVEVTNKYLGKSNFEVTGGLAIAPTIHKYEGNISKGTVFESIQGILLYSFDAFRLAPRANDDLVEREQPPVEPTDPTEPAEVETTTIKAIQSGTVAERTAVKIEKAIVISPVIEQTKGGNTMYSFYVSDGNTGDYSGLYIYNATAETAPVKGDELTIEGKALYYKNSQSELGQWEIGSKDDVSCKITEKTGTGKTVPAALQKAYTALSDKDKGSLIEINELTVKSVETPEGKNYTKITFEEKVGDKELIAENFGNVTFQTYQAGDVLYVKGIYDVIFGSNGFYILNANDIEKRIY